MSLSCLDPAPQKGLVRCEVRFRDSDERFCRFAIQLIVDDQVWLRCDLTEIMMPKGPLGSAAPADRRTFLRDRQPVAEMSLSRVEGTTHPA